MSDQLIVERGGLAKKDKSELQAIVVALGGTAPARLRKAELIDRILELSGATSTDEANPEDSGSVEGAGSPPKEPSAAAGSAGDASGTSASPEASDSSDASSKASNTGPKKDSNDEASASRASSSSATGPANGTGNSHSGRQKRDNRRSNGSGKHPVGPDGEPLADWEVAVMADSGKGKSDNQGRSEKGNRGRNGGGRSDRSRGDNPNNSPKQDNNNGGNASNRNDDDDPNNRRGRRRGRGRGRDRDDAGNDPISAEPLPVEGYLDLRDEGYGFLRVSGNLPSKSDVYVSVKHVRQYGLRKGDHLTGSSRPANRNEKNPGFHQIDTVNGGPPEQGRNRPHFDQLTPLFPDERLRMEMAEEPYNMTTRIIDLVSPIGKGQRGLIVAPPKAGKTTVIKDIARAIETNHPEVVQVVLLLDERPEEVTDMERHLKNSEVVASTFDRPPEEHTAVAELTIERAKRFVEHGKDVVVIVDGITRLSRAYNLSAPQSGRAMSGGLDAAALYPPKRFFGAARNLEEGGSLTILATALVETGSKMDEVIFEEFKGTGNMELRLDRSLSEKRIYPAIDIDSSSTRHEELLFDRKQLSQAWKMRRVLSGLSEKGSSAGIEMLVERLQTFKTNDDFLAEIAKAPSL